MARMLDGGLSKGHLVSGRVSVTWVIVSQLGLMGRRAIGKIDWPLRTQEDGV